MRMSPIGSDIWTQLVCCLGDDMGRYSLAVGSKSLAWALKAHTLASLPGCSFCSLFAVEAVLSLPLLLLPCLSAMMNSYPLGTIAHANSTWDAFHPGVSITAAEKWRIQGTLLSPSGTLGGWAREIRFQASLNYIAKSCTPKPNQTSGVTVCKAKCSNSTVYQSL